MSDKGVITEPYDVLGAGAGGPLPAQSPWTNYAGYLGYLGGVVVGTGSNMGPGTINTTGIYISGSLFGPTTVLQLVGGTLTGPLILAADPTNVKGAATKQYVDNAVSTAGTGTFLPLSGGTMTGLLTLSADPVAALGAATRQYVISRTPITTDAPANGTYYTRYNNTWQPAPSGITIADAPGDGNTYARLNSAWTSTYDGNVGTNALKIQRSGVGGSRPTGRAYGEPYANFVDNQFGVVNSSGAAQDFLGTTIFSTTASYTSGGAIVNNSGRLYRSLAAVTPGAFNPAQWTPLVTQTDTDAAYLRFTGGTLTGPLILQADPTVALGAATKQYVDNKPAGGAPQCGYFYAANAGLCYFVPYNGNTIRINNVDRVFTTLNCPYQNTYVEGVAGQNLAANTLYYVYVFWTGSAIAPNFSTTGYGIGSNGVSVKGNDASQTLIGLVRVDGNAYFNDNNNLRWVSSWYNRRRKTSITGLGNSSTSSSGWTALGAVVYLVTWGEEDVESWTVGQMGTSGNYGQLCIGLDGSPPWGATTTFSADYQTTSGGGAAMTFGSGPVGSAGLHYFQAFIAANGGTVYYNNANLFAAFRG